MSELLASCGKLSGAHEWRGSQGVYIARHKELAKITVGPIPEVLGQWVEDNMFINDLAIVHVQNALRSP